MRKKQFILYFAAAAAAAGIGLGACSSGSGTEKKAVTPVPAGQETAGQGAAGQGAAAGEAAGLEASGREPLENPGSTGQSNEDFSGRVESAENGIRTETVRGTGQASKQESAKAPVLRLKLPDDEGSFSSPAIIQEDENTIQIQFHDENTQSDAMAWASLEAGGGPSEYYMFDEEGTEQQEVSAGEKFRVKMTIKKTVENSDIHGILVSWEHEGVFYELWEDDARDSMDAVIDTASAIAARSTGPQGN